MLPLPRNFASIYQYCLNNAKQNMAYLPPESAGYRVKWVLVYSTYLIIPQ